MDNVIVVVVIESKKKKSMMLLPGSRGTFPSRVVVVASFARCQGKSIECMFLWYGVVFLCVCVCVVFRFVCLFETQLLTGHH